MLYIHSLFSYIRGGVCCFLSRLSWLSNLTGACVKDDSGQYHESVHGPYLVGHAMQGVGPLLRVGLRHHDMGGRCHAHSKRYEIVYDCFLQRDH